jgi:iron-sulfur cluster repair protein YtfE (RIC family)
LLVLNVICCPHVDLESIWWVTLWIATAKVESQADCTEELQKLNAIAFTTYHDTIRSFFMTRPRLFAKHVRATFGDRPTILVELVLEMNNLLQGLYYEAEAVENEDGTEFVNMTAVTERADAPIRTLVEKMQSAVGDTRV